MSENADEPSGARPWQAVVRGGAESFTQEISLGPHRLLADEPVDRGGADAGPDPYDLLLASLGACTSMTLALYARRKGWPLEAVTVKLRHSRIHAQDCEHCETEDGWLDRIERGLELEGPLSDEQRGRLVEIADRCPVSKTLLSEVDLQTRLL